jgi:hypothetical protein
MQNVLCVLHLPLAWQVAPPQSADVAHVHCPEFLSQVLPELHEALLVHCAARAQLPPCGGYDWLFDAAADSPTQTGYGQ